MYGSNVESNSTGGVAPEVGIIENCEMVGITMKLGW